MERLIGRLFLGLVFFFLVIEAAFSLEINNQDLRNKARLYGVIPSTMPGSQSDTPEMIALGRELYFEKALSINQSQSCNTCHNILDGGQGVDNLTVPVGALGKTLRRNAPSTFNAGFQFSQNWDTSASTLVEQAKKVLLNKDEMAMPSEQAVVERLNNRYRQAFSTAFPESSDALSFENVATALAAFQRTLITHDRFDLFIEGDNDALSAQEKRGFLLFQNKGCASCHSGPLMGGQFAMKIGVVVPYPNTKDKGLAEVTGRDAHNFLFKVPILRNVANTAPYFHDGAGETLEEAVFLTGWHQLGQKMTTSEVGDISAFLRSLNNITPFNSTASLHGSR